jgi:EamA domain-containing membrane protein RarD
LDVSVPCAPGTYINLVPMFGLAAGASFLGDRLQRRQWSGVAIDLAAVTVCSRHTIVASSEAGQHPVKDQADAHHDPPISTRP